MRDLIFIGRIPEPIKYFREHMHDVWEIVYYTHGTGIVKVGAVDVPFQPGTIVCLPPNIPHMENSEVGYCNYYFMVKTFYSRKDMAIKLQDNDGRDYYTVLGHMYKEFHKKYSYWRNITESLLSILYQYMTAWHTAFERNPLIERFENTLISNMSNPLFNIEKEMENIPLSKDHFRRIFRKETGKTPLQYLTDKRLAHARRLLESNSSGTLRIMEIAAMAGFDDPYYFSRVFRKHTGKAPTEVKLIS